MTHEEKIDLLSKLCAVFIVIEHSAEILSRRIELMAATERMAMTRENKKALTGIMQAAQKMQFHMEHFTDWAMAAAVTKEGKVGGMSSYDVLQNDASDLLRLVMLWHDWCYEDDNARVLVESMMRNRIKSETPPIPLDVIESLKVKV